MLKGILPPLTTPFQDDEVAYDKLADNITKYNSFNLAGYVVFGSNGESVFLTKEEKLKLILTAREHANTEKKIIAGTGLESIKDTISLSNDAAKNGADYALIITPSFYKSAMNHDVLVEYFTIIADSVSIPVILYNVTKFTNVNINTDTVVKLAEHSNIIGLKNSSENIAQISETISNTPDDFIILAGTGSVLLPALYAGAAGGVLALANIAPDECISIYNLFKDGKLDEAQNIQNKMLAVNKAITAKYGVAGLKTAMGLLGYYGGLPRKPLQPLSSNQMHDLKTVLTNAGLFE
ncbi:MAG: dihydrodipicolinate synthase family protein [Ignavibacterium sp.]|nr:MAG: dihydrodipicolinate synthase family protein [Ignavibacterium sp.]